MIDAAGNVVTSFPIDAGVGDQLKPHVAWNGQHWLVAWIEDKPGLPVTQRIRGVRVAPDGSVVDAEPITIQDAGTYYFSFFGMALAGGGADGWVLVTQGNDNGLRAVRIASDGSVVNPAGVVVSSQLSSLSWDIAFAQDEYMIVYGTGTSATARRYSQTLQFLGATSIPFARAIATDGTDFLVTGQHDFSWPPKIEATLLGHDGTVLAPRFTVIQGTSQWSPSGEDAGFDGTNYWVTWGGISAARISPAGAMIDPVGGFNLPLDWQTTSWPAYDTAPGGGLQYLWHDGLGGLGYAKDAHTARLTPAGQLTNQQAVSVSPPAQVEADVARGDGTHMIVFRSRSSGAARILAQRLDDAGTPLDAEPIEVAAGPVEWLDTPSIGQPGVAWNGSVFMVAWSDTVNVYVRRMNPDGSFVDASPITVLTGQHAAVGALGSDFLVSGTTVGTLLATGALRVARVDGITGAVLDTPPITLSAPTLAGQYPHIDAFGGRWLVVWESVYRDQHSTTVIHSAAHAFVEPDGTTTGQLGSGVGERPGVGIAGDRALIIGIDDTVPGGYTDLEARILMADGSYLGPTFLLSSAPEDQLRPTATWDGTQFLAAWEDKRNAVVYFDERTDIYGARVSADGVVLDPAGIALAAAPEVEIQPEFLTTAGGTLLAVSKLRMDDPATGVFRLGIHGADAPTWFDLGGGTSGAFGMPALTGEGTLAAGTTVTLTLESAPPTELTLLWVSTTSTPLPFFGGLIHAFPEDLGVLLTTDGTGAVVAGGTWPAGIPAGTNLWFQFLVRDLTMPGEIVLSNALRATTP